MPIPTYRGVPSTPASDVDGTDLEGGPVRLRVADGGGWTLLLFLSTSCEGCREVWGSLDGTLAAGATGAVPVVVTRGPGEEDPDQLRCLAPPTVTVVQSSLAWRAYRVHGPPFFALVGGREPRVVAEGVAWASVQVAEELARHVGTAVPGDPGGDPPAGAG